MNSVTKEEIINDCVDNFDADKVHRVMEFLDWHWASTAFGVPTQGEIRQKLRSLCNQAYETGTKEGQWVEMGTGGLHAKYLPGTNRMRVWFSVTDWEAPFV